MEATDTVIVQEEPDQGGYYKNVEKDEADEGPTDIFPRSSPLFGKGYTSIESMIQARNIQSMAEPGRDQEFRFVRDDQDFLATEHLMKCLVSWEDSYMGKVYAAPTNVIEKTIPWFTKYRFEIPDLQPCKGIRYEQTSQKYAYIADTFLRCAMVPIPVYTSPLLVLLSRNSDVCSQGLEDFGFPKVMPGHHAIIVYLAALQRFADKEVYGDAAINIDAMFRGVMEIFIKYLDKGKIHHERPESLSLYKSWSHYVLETMNSSADEIKAGKLSAMVKALTTETLKNCNFLFSIWARSTYEQLVYMEMAIIERLGIPKGWGNVLCTPHKIPDMTKVTPYMHTELTQAFRAFDMNMEALDIQTRFCKTLQEIPPHMQASYVMVEPLVNHYARVSLSTRTLVSATRYLTNMEKVGYIDYSLHKPASTPKKDMDDDLDAGPEEM